ncbi:transcriptional regulator LicR [Gottschalkiaceae bacterium SANA]|nr:transcriptional regulator LicR [Gottschalkiaceae bacterium SANA]
MLLPREKQLLKILYHANKELTSVQLSCILQVSSRTVKNDIKKLRTELSFVNCMIIAKPGKGFWLEYPNKSKPFIENLLAINTDDHLLLPENRKFLIALKMLEKDDYISMEAISNEMFISKSTVMNDIEKLEKSFSKHELHLEKSTRYGIRIHGDEFNKRMTLVYVLKKIAKQKGNLSLDNLQEHFTAIELKCIGQLIQKIEIRFDLVFSDQSYISIVLQLAIMINRIKDNKLCTLKNIEISENTLEWKITDFILHHLEDHYNCRVSQNEKEYLYINVTGIKYQKKDIYQNRKLDDIRNISPETFDGITEIINIADELFNENLSADKEFIISLFIHLNALFIRIMNSIYLENPLKKSIKNDLAYEYEVATYISTLLVQNHYSLINDDDICDIALYIGASLKRQKTIRYTPSIVIVCGSGMSTSQFIEAKIKSAFPNVVVKDIVPLYRANKIKINEQDFVISTVPLHLEGIEVIVIPPTLSKKTMNALRDIFSQTSDQSSSPRKESYDLFFKQVKSNLCCLKSDCKNKKEVINLLGTRMQTQNYVDDGFIESVFRRECLSPTCVGNGFATPHSFKGHIIKPAIGIMTLKKPIQWDNEKVSIVFMIALDPDQSDSFKTIFKQLADLTSDIELIENMLEANNFKEFIQIFK